MNKFNLQKDEKNRILSMHKALIKEQATVADAPKSVSDQLQVFITNGCAKNGKVVKMKSTNPQKEYAIKQESTKTPGKFRYLFIDKTVGMNDETGKFQISSNKWSCDISKVQANASAEQAVTTDLNNNLTQMKDRGWMEYSELTKNGFNTLEAKEGKYETTQFDMGNGNKITLYKPKNIGGELKQYTKVQQDLLNKYKESGYKLKSEIGLDEIGSWEQFTLNFPDGSGSVILYKDPSFVGKVEAGSEPSMEKQDALISGDKRAKVCREKIKDFADSANKKLKLPMSQINANKTFVMACRDQFGMKYNDLGVTKKNLEYLTGQRDGLDGYKLKVGSPYRL